MATMRVLTADEVLTRVKEHQKMTTKEKKEFNLKREQLEGYHDLRDDVVSIIKNSNKTLEQIHAECGPHPATMVNWIEKKVSQPRLGKIRSVLRICGYDLGIVDKDGNAFLTKRGN